MIKFRSQTGTERDLFFSNLQNLFGTIRQKLGGNTNPTPEHFSNLFKKVMVHQHIKFVKSGNCIDDQTKSGDTIILQYFMEELKENAAPTQSAKAAESVPDEILVDIGFVPDGKCLDVHHKELAYYQIGVVLFYMIKKIDCECCLSRFRLGPGDPKPREAAYVVHKDTVKLVYAHHEVLPFFYDLESLIRHIAKKLPKELDKGCALLKFAKEAALTTWQFGSAMKSVLAVPTCDAGHDLEKFLKSAGSQYLKNRFNQTFRVMQRKSGEAKKQCKSKAVKRTKKNKNEIKNNISS
jgi:hypothetical protein